MQDFEGKTTLFQLVAKQCLYCEALVEDDVLVEEVVVSDLANNNKDNKLALVIRAKYCFLYYMTVLLNEIEDLKGVLKRVPTKQTNSRGDAPSSDISHLAHTNITETNTDIANGLSYHANGRRQACAASRIYERYSPEVQDAFNIFTVQQDSIADNILSLKSLLKIKNQELKDIASLKERSQEKSLSLSKMLKTHITNSITQYNTDYETHLKCRILQEEKMSRNAMSKLQAVKTDIYRVREQLEVERMQLIAKFECLRLSADLEAESSKQTTSQVSLLLENSVEGDHLQLLREMDNVSGNHGDIECEDVSLSVISEEEASRLGDDTSKDSDTHSKNSRSSSKYKCITADHNVIKPMISKQNLLESCTNGESVSRPESSQRCNIGNCANNMGKVKKTKKIVDLDISIEINNGNLISMITERTDVSISAVSSCSETPVSIASDKEHSNHKKPEQHNIINEQSLLQHQRNKHESSTCQPLTNADHQLSESEDKDATETVKDRLLIDESGLTGDPEIDEVVFEFYKSRGRLFM